jgi:O-acetyl-ADP-ribose deacetylase (regulator of RNase III)
MHADAIVNTANPQPVIGSGVDQRIHEAAGPRLLEARQHIGSITVGDAFITPGFSLDAKYVIHTVGPVWQGGTRGEYVLLCSCYSRSLHLARQWGCQSVAFPLISSGNYGFPRDLALKAATETIGAFLKENEMQVYLVVYARESVRLSEQLRFQVLRYISDNQLQEHIPRYRREAPPVFPCAAPSAPMVEPEKKKRPGGFSLPLKRQPKEPYAPVPHSTAPMDLPTAADFSREEPACLGGSLPDFVPDAGFSETLLDLIDRTGKKDSEIYKKANISKQHFSKIRNNPDYKPTKPTAIALAIALELSLEETKDLIGRAGFALTKSSVFDLIIMFFIQQGNYNVVDINIALYEFDQSLLGC